MNLGLTAWPKCLPLKNLEGLNRSCNSTESFCKYQQKKYDFNRFSADFCFMIRQPIGLGNIKKHSITWATLNFKIGSK